MSKIRWLLIFPICILGWYLAFYLGLLAHGLVWSLCPADQIISGSCVAPWFRVAENSLFVLFTGVSAIFVISLAYLIAPSHKKNTAITALVLGSLVATFMLFKTGAWAGYFSALVCGILSVWMVSGIGRRRRDT